MKKNLNHDFCHECRLTVGTVYDGVVGITTHYIYDQFICQECQTIRQAQAILERLNHQQRYKEALEILKNEKETN